MATATGRGTLRSSSAPGSCHPSTSQPISVRNRVPSTAEPRTSRARNVPEVRKCSTLLTTLSRGHSR
ncbi:hypothetical protein ACFH04_05650 [Streptomyces noboritoensis]|uniref:Uncharacterized protein n=1 Tax=Streptomyces noboritoensis TaxID=67337 RepID=A0ABV6TBQ4_9ACTN